MRQLLKGVSGSADTVEAGRSGGRLADRAGRLTEAPGAAVLAGASAGKGRRLLPVLAAVVAAASLAGTARADSGLVFGFAADEPKWAGSSASSVAHARALGGRALRITLPWDGVSTTLPSNEVTEIGRALAAAPDMRMIVSVYGVGRVAPLDDLSRDRFCAYMRDVLVRFPTINDLVVWNEPNGNYFWKPQYNADGTPASPAAYQALLARCWDVLHAHRPSVNVIGFATAPHGNDNPQSSHLAVSAANFIRKAGEAYRASGRTQRLFDTIDHHPYGSNPRERPWKRHTSPSLSQGDWDKLMSALTDAFGGTGQPIPGQCPPAGCVYIWYLEGGFQTVPDPDKAPFYSGVENWVPPIVDDAGGEPSEPTPHVDTLAPDHSTQIRYALRLAYCQPHVRMFLNFLIWDEPDIARWQSGALWTDRTPKGSYGAFQAAAAEVNARAVVCTAPTPPPTPAARVEPAGNAARITWGASSSTIGVAGYRLFRDGAFLVRTTSLGYVDPNLEVGRTYTYTVRAFDAAGNESAASAAATVTIGNAPAPAPVPPTPFHLVVAKGGSGSGTVVSAPGLGISCGLSCTVAAPAGATVTLTARADAGSVFGGWSGACSGTGACTLVFDADKSVTAAFDVVPTARGQLLVTTHGKGRVASAPGGIACGTQCAAEYALGTSVVLRAAPARGQRFGGWGGACASVRRAPACTVTIDRSTSVSARFVRRTCTVPGLAGRTLARARRALARADCRLGRTTRVRSAVRQRGRVVSQKPKRGTRLAPGSRVSVAVGRGPKRTAKR